MPETLWWRASEAFRSLIYLDDPKFVIPIVFVYPRDDLPKILSEKKAEFCPVDVRRSKTWTHYFLRPQPLRRACLPLHVGFAVAFSLPEKCEK